MYNGCLMYALLWLKKNAWIGTDVLHQYTEKILVFQIEDVLVTGYIVNIEFPKMNNTVM